MDERLLKQGMFSWNELMTTDVEGARKFYTELLGWTTEELQMEGGNYTVIKAGGEEIGGMMITPPQAEGVPPHWGAYVTVDDVDATATTAKDLSGNILVPPTDIPDVGRFSVIQDPQGAAIAIITYLKRD
jgi:predicted enzyme related to lactoylglutathione lyase